jgi:hypothetical protein
MSMMSDDYYSKETIDRARIEDTMHTGAARVGMVGPGTQARRVWAWWGPAIESRLLNLSSAFIIIQRVNSDFKLLR